MGIFRKESSTHFERDEAGNVTSVVRTGDKPKSGLFDRETKTPISDKLLQQKESRPSVRSERKMERMKQRKAEREAYHKSYNQARIKSNAARGRQMGSMTTGQRINSMFPSYVGPSSRNANPFGSMFDTGMDYSPRSKVSKPKKKYTVINNVAYPIAGSKRKKSKKKGKKGKKSDGWDVFNAFGEF